MTEELEIDLQIVNFREIHSLDPEIVSRLDGNPVSLLRTVFVGAVECGEGFGDLIGYAAYDLEDPHENQLQHVFVAESHRAMGIGGSLAKSQCATGVPLFAMVEEEDLQAQLFLRACGYEAVEIHEHDDGTNCYRMEVTKE